MGRLFWKFFFFIWLAQLTSVFAVSGLFWWEHRRDEAHWMAVLAERGPPPQAPPAGSERHPPHEGERMPHGDASGRPPPPPRDGHPPPRPPRHGFPPLEPVMAAFLGSLVFAALLARYFSKPIHGLRTAFQAVAAGRLDARVGDGMGGRRDELADLGRDFDHMAERLQVLVENQRRLLHDVSHELRSPLGRLQAAVGLAHQQPARMADWMERIERESWRIDRLVGELLTLARLDAGVTGARDEVELAELVAGIVDDAGFEAAAKTCRVCAAGEFDGVVRGDGELLSRAVENVVRNAVKFAPAGSQVDVLGEIDAVSGRARISVSDRGPGVAETDLKAIFEPFFCAAESRSQGGHGLGLAIAKRVVESIGGAMHAANRAQGGLRVVIELPIALPA